MSLASIWDRLRRNLLTFGYVRSTFKDTPEDIIKVILSFYDDMKYWTISKGKQMTKFFNCKCKEILYGPSFTMKNIEFQCLVSPNGYEDDHKGKVVLILSVSKVPTNVKHIYVYFILFNNETKYEHKVTRILTEHNINDENKYRWRSRFPWATNAVNLSDLKLFNSITFGYYVDIIHISYKINEKTIDILNQNQKKIVTKKYLDLDIKKNDKKLQNIVDLIVKFEGEPYWTKGIKISSNISYKWIVSNDKLNQMQNCQFGQHFYSSNFDNNNWCLYISPAGWTNENKGLFSFQLKLLQRPYKLAAIYVVYHLECKFKNITIKKSQIFHYRSCRSGWEFNQYKIPFDEFKVLDNIVIKLQLTIVAGYDINTRERIKKNEWNEYGIVNNNNEMIAK